MNKDIEFFIYNYCIDKKNIIKTRWTLNSLTHEWLSMPKSYLWHFSFSVFHKLHAAKYSTSRQVSILQKKYHWYHHHDGCHHKHNDRSLQHIMIWMCLWQEQWLITNSQSAASSVWLIELHDVIRRSSCFQHFRPQWTHNSIYKNQLNFSFLKLKVLLDVKMVRECWLKSFFIYVKYHIYVFSFYLLVSFIVFNFYRPKKKGKHQKK